MPVPNSIALLSEARSRIGKVSYSDIDCSHYIHESYKNVGLEYPYRNTATFESLVTEGYFEEIKDRGSKQSGDVLLFKGHMGIWDPDGCKILMKDDVCLSQNGNAPFLSSRGKIVEGKPVGRGPSFGITNWFGTDYKVLRWKGKPTTQPKTAK